LATGLLVRDFSFVTGLLVGWLLATGLLFDATAAVDLEQFPATTLVAFQNVG
jgi:hypothetical protein